MVLLDRRPSDGSAPAAGKPDTGKSAPADEDFSIPDFNDEDIPFS